MLQRRRLDVVRWDVAITSLSTMAAGVALRLLPLAVLVGLLVLLVAVAATCAWLLCRPVLPSEPPATEPAAGAQPRDPVSTGPPARRLVAPPGAALVDVVRRLESLEAHQRWIDSGVADLEAYAQAPAAVEADPGDWSLFRPR